MALISCPECKANISDKAASCPGCGHPMTPLAGRGEGPLVTTQLTAKRYKAAQAIGATLIFCGMFSCMGGEQTAPVTGFLFLGGLALAIWGKWSAWWHHS
jgi:hypothetical protein